MDRLRDGAGTSDEAGMHQALQSLIVDERFQEGLGRFAENRDEASEFANDPAAYCTERGFDFPAGLELVDVHISEEPNRITGLFTYGTWQITAQWNFELAFYAIWGNSAGEKRRTGSVSTSE